MSDNETEVESYVLDPFTAPVPTQTVVLAWAYTDVDGNEHGPDTRIELDRDEANRLLSAGLARTTEQDDQQRAELEAEVKAQASDRIDDVLAEVGDDPAKAAAALEAEKAGKNRPTLVSKLEALTKIQEN